MSWTDAKIEQLRALWNEGLSASQVARVIGGVTRNAVIGKVHRMGLAGRAGPRPRATYVQPRAGRIFVEPERPAPPPEPADAITLESGARVTIANVQNGQCRWPHGDPATPEFHLCGNETLVGSVYCLAHSRKAYQAGNPRPKRDDAAEELAAIAKAERTFA